MSTKASQNQPAGNIVQILNDLTWMTAKAQRVLTQRRELVGGVQSRYGCDKQLLQLS
jgi:hypothetical protein